MVTMLEVQNKHVGVQHSWSTDERYKINMYTFNDSDERSERWTMNVLTFNIFAVDDVRSTGVNT